MLEEHWDSTSFQTECVFWKRNFRTGELKASEICSYLCDTLDSHFRRLETGGFLAHCVVSWLWEHLSHTDADICTDTVESQRTCQRKVASSRRKVRDRHEIPTVARWYRTVIKYPQILLGLMPSWPFENLQIVFMCVHTCLHLCAPYMYRRPWRLKDGVGSLGLELQGVTTHVGAANQTQIF